MDELKNLVLFEMTENYIRLLECESSALVSKLHTPDYTLRLETKLLLEMLSKKKAVALELKVNLMNNTMEE